MSGGDASFANPFVDSLLALLNDNSVVRPFRSQLKALTTLLSFSEAGRPDLCAA